MIRFLLALLVGFVLGVAVRPIIPDRVTDYVDDVMPVLRVWAYYHPQKGHGSYSYLADLMPPGSSVADYIQAGWSVKTQGPHSLLLQKGDGFVWCDVSVEAGSPVKTVFCSDVR